MAVELKPHQEEAVNQLKNGAILKGGVGTGKSRVAIAYYFEQCGGSYKGGEFKPFTDPKDLYIITTAKKRNDADWIEECAPFSLSSNPSASFGGVAVHVDSWNNILNYQDVKGAFFVFDEQRLVGSGPWVKAFLKIAQANDWIVLSATPGDNWMDYVPVFVANGYYKNRTEFLRTHVVWKTFSRFPQISHYVETGRLTKLRNRLIVDMPYERHTVRNILNITCDYNKALYNRVTKDRWHIYEERPLNDVSEMFSVMRKLVNSDVSRVGEMMKLMEKHPKLIVFYTFNYELELLRTLASTLNYPVGEWNGHKHQSIPETSKWLYLVQYMAGAEGWNCIETDAIAFFSLQYSWKMFEQAKGRIDRLNTKFTQLYYYVLRSTAPIDNAIVKALAVKRDFNMMDLVKEKW